MGQLGKRGCSWCILVSDDCLRWLAPFLTKTERPPPWHSCSFSEAGWEASVFQLCPVYSLGVVCQHLWFYNHIFLFLMSERGDGETDSTLFFLALGCERKELSKHERKRWQLIDLAGWVGVPKVQVFGNKSSRFLWVLLFSVWASKTYAYTFKGSASTWPPPLPAFPHHFSYCLCWDYTHAY